MLTFNEQAGSVGSAHVYDVIEHFKKHSEHGDEHAGDMATALVCVCDSDIVFDMSSMLLWRLLAGATNMSTSYNMSTAASRYMAFGKHLICCDMTNILVEKNKPQALFS